MQNQHLSLALALLLWSVKQASALADHEVEEREAALPIALLCAAYSTEIGLKGILQSQHKAAEGHDLGAMYRQLPQAVQSSILARGGFSESELQERLDDFSTSCAALGSLCRGHGTDIAVTFLQRLAGAVHTELEERIRTAEPGRLAL